MAREGSKRQIAIEIMTANADKPMAEVLPIIQDACALNSLSAARGYYKNLCENFGVPGKVEPRAKKIKVNTVSKTKKEAIAEEKTETKSVDEIEKIRKANLEKIRQVHKKMIAEGKMPNTLKEEDDSDSAEYPEFLNKEEAIELVGGKADLAFEE